MVEKKDVRTENRLTALEVQQQNDAKAMEVGFEAVYAGLRDLKVTVKEEMLELRGDLNKNIRKSNERFEKVEGRVAINDKFRERLAVYLTVGGVLLGLVFTYFKDILHWIFQR